MSTVFNRSIQWFKNHIPTRESMEHNRWMRPFAHHLMHSELWRPTRRSVQRGVALGLFVGVMIPLAHFIVATFIAVFVRANIPAALAATFIGFPVIYVGLVALAYKIGKWVFHLDAMTTIQPIAGTMQTTDAGHFLQRLTGAGLHTAFGLFVIATLLASLGYLITGLVWRWRLGRKVIARRERFRRAGK